MTARGLYCFSVLSICCLYFASPCKETRYTLKHDSAQKGILCSSQIEDIARRRRGDIFRRDGVIGIYKLNETIGRVCYWKHVSKGLDLNTLTGGTFLSLGMSI